MILGYIYHYTIEHHTVDTKSRDHPKPADSSETTTNPHKKAPKRPVSERNHPKPAKPPETTRNHPKQGKTTQIGLFRVVSLVSGSFIPKRAVSEPFWVGSWWFRVGLLVIRHYTIVL